MDKVVVPSGYNASVPMRKVLFEISIPTEEWLASYGTDTAYTRAFAVNQCSPMDEIAKLIFNGPIEWVDGDGEHNGYYRSQSDAGVKS